MPRHPNVLFMISDDHRASAIAANGDEVVRTPSLDALAARGVNFARAHTMGGLSVGVCIPSRASVLTGANPFRASMSTIIGDTHGIYTLNPECQSMPATFRAAGYRTFATGKWHNDRRSFSQAFSAADSVFFGGMCNHDYVPVHDYDPGGLYLDDKLRIGGAFSSQLFADAAIRFLRNHAGDTPFFAYVAFTAPHDPRTPPAEFAAMYPTAAMPLPPNFMATHPFDNGEIACRDELLAAHPRDPAEIQRHIADYYGMVTHMDAQIGRILAALDETGHAEDTVVVYTADHGLADGQHGLMGKQNPYEHSVRVPLMLRGPGLPTCVRSDAIAMNRDIFPTLCELTGVPVPSSVEGASLIPALHGTVVNDTAFWSYKDVQRMVSDGRWKLIRYYQVDGRGEDRLQLFDLRNDPWERHDLSADADAAAHVRRLADALAAWQRATHDPYCRAPSLPR